MTTRASVRGALLIASAAGIVTAGAFFGCGDIFHSTDFPSADGGGGGGGSLVTPEGGFCSWSEATAKTNALNACALVAACQSPIGDNAVGTCIVNATLAYDCAANPNRPVIGQALAYWQCVASAKTCADVDSCVYGDPPDVTKRVSPPTCGGSGSSFTACGKSAQANSRLDCRAPGDPSLGESCLATGHTCATKNGGEALCLGGEGIACTKTSCGGTQLDFCVDAGGGTTFDRGVDCASYGAGSCVDKDAGPTCEPVVGDAGTCAPSPGIRCAQDVALGCGAGIPERVDCAALANGVTCNASQTAPAYDIAAGCFARTPTCSNDSCSGAALNACVRGASVTVDCISLGLGPCTQVNTTDGVRASCSAPQ
ncbi:MAG: hypothetical protein ABI461_02085 [Polyangiaceae bacterium]